MTWLTWLPRLIVFGLWFLKELLVSNVTVIADNLTPGQRSQPGIAQLPTHCRTEFEVTLLASIISLTPGTLTLAHRMSGAVEEAWPDAFQQEGESQDDSDRVRFLYVHGMYSKGPDDLRASLSRMEHHMLAAVRREGFTP